MNNEIVVPWTWYVSRATALVAFLLLYISLFLGAISIFPIIKRKFLILGSLRMHCWISAQAFLFALIHGLSFHFDYLLKLSFKDIFVPFTASYKPLFTGLGTISLYLILALTLSSYLRSHISYRLWRTLHSLNLLLYIIGTAHALFLGTDLKTGALRDIFIYANIFLIFFILLSIFLKLAETWRDEKISV